VRDFVLLAPSSAMATEAVGTITRFLVGSLLLSHGVRPDVRASIIFDGDHCVSFDGGSMRNVRPDEQSLSGIIRAGLRRAEPGPKSRVMQGIHAYVSPFLEEAKGAKGVRFYYRSRGGRVPDLSTDFTAFFQVPSLARDVEEALAKEGFLGSNLGFEATAPDQAVVLLNNRVDRAVPAKNLAKIGFQGP